MTQDVFTALADPTRRALLEEPGVGVEEGQQVQAHRHDAHADEQSGHRITLEPVEFVR